MTSLMNKTVNQLTVDELVQILKQYAPVLSTPVQEKKGGKQKKVKDPNAPKKEVSAGVAAWNAVVADVLEDMKASGWTHPETGKPVTRKDAMAEASKRKSDSDPEYAAKAEARKQKRDDRKNSDASEHEEIVKEVAATAVVAVADKPSASVADKPKKVISPEQKEKMLAGAKAAREAKKATAVAAAPAPASPPAAAPSIVTKSPKKVAKAAAAPVAEPAEEEWIRKTISGKKYLWNPMNNHCYKAEADGSQGDWAGLYDPKKSKIDDSAEEPVEFETA